MVKNILKTNKKIILASQSPRRKKLLELLGFDFEILPADIDENIDFDSNYPEHTARILAEDKAKAIGEDINYPAYIIGADTIVVYDNKILNKPADENEAFQMLRTLSGNTHIVFTGISIYDTEKKKSTTKHQKTYVSFRELSDEEIYSYIATGSPMDKAGSYGIQDDFGAVFVHHIEGCYYNIVGLPIELLYRTMKEIIDEEAER